MVCLCGKKLVYHGIENGCHVLVCPHCTDKHKIPKQYRIPVEDPRKLPFPWEIPRVKVYHCRGCRMPITEEQATKTFEEEGRALCVSCVGHR